MSSTSKLLLYVGGLVLSACLAIWLLEQIRQQQQHIDFLTDQYARLAGRIVDDTSLEKAVNDMEKVAPDQMGFLNVSTDEAAVAYLRDVVVRRGAEEQFQISSTAPQPVKRDGRIARSVLLFSLTGPALHGLDFVNSIEKTSSAIFFSSLDIAAAQGAADDSSRLVAINGAIEGYWVVPAAAAAKG